MVSCLHDVICRKVVQAVLADFCATLPAAKPAFATLL
jgi:hypothetical protein